MRNFVFMAVLGMALLSSSAVLAAGCDPDPDVPTEMNTGIADACDPTPELPAGVNVPPLSTVTSTPSRLRSQLNGQLQNAKDKFKDAEANKASMQADIEAGIGVPNPAGTTADYSASGLGNRPGSPSGVTSGGYTDAAPSPWYDSSSQGLTFNLPPRINLADPCTHPDGWDAQAANGTPCPGPRPADLDCHADIQPYNTAYCIGDTAGCSSSPETQYVQADTFGPPACNCDNPLSGACNECYDAGDTDVCSAGQYVQADCYSACGCDNPLTGGYDECYTAGDSCAGGFIQVSGSSTCGCDNPTTGGYNECYTAGDTCAGGFIQTSGDATCGCNNPTTPADECGGGGGGGGGGGCFVANTDILLADGSTKKISDLKVGDSVMSYDKMGEITGGLKPNRVTHVFLLDEKDVYEVAGVKVTNTHPFLTDKGEMIALKDLKAYDKIVLKDGSTVPVGDVKPAGREKVYNFTVDQAHSYIANGLRVGNMTVPLLPEGTYTEHDLLIKALAVAKH